MCKLKDGHLVWWGWWWWWWWWWLMMMMMIPAAALAHATATKSSWKKSRCLSKFSQNWKQIRVKYFAFVSNCIWQHTCKVIFITFGQGQGRELIIVLDKSPLDLSVDNDINIFCEKRNPRHLWGRNIFLWKAPEGQGALQRKPVNPGRSSHHHYHHCRHHPMFLFLQSLLSSYNDNVITIIIILLI